MGSSVRENKHLPLSQPVTLMSPDQTQLLESRQQPRIGKCSRRCSRSLTSAPCTKCSQLESATPKQDKCIQTTPLDYSLLMEEIQTSGTASSPKSIPTTPFPGQKVIRGNFIMCINVTFKGLQWNSPNIFLDNGYQPSRMWFLLVHTSWKSKDLPCSLIQDWSLWSLTQIQSHWPTQQDCGLEMPSSTGSLVRDLSSKEVSSSETSLKPEKLSRTNSLVFVVMYSLVLVLTYSELM